MAPIRRRTFLAYIIGGTVAGAVAAVAAVLDALLSPPAVTRPAIKLPKPLEQMRDGDVVAVGAPAGWALVTADGRGANRPGGRTRDAFLVHSCGKTEVLSAGCSHLGCSVDWSASRSRFECPCHGSIYQPSCAPDARSQFSIDGSVSHGPAQYPMAHVRWQPGRAPDEIELEMVRSS